MRKIRHIFRRQRLGIYALTLLQVFFMVGGSEAVQTRQQGKLLAEAESARLARNFGVPFERWQSDAPNWLEKSRAAVAQEVGEIVDHSRNEMSRLIDELTVVDPEDVTTTSSVVSHLTQDAGLAGSADSASQVGKKPRYIPKRPALDAGEGERSVVRRPLAAKAQTSLKTQAEDVLPLHRVVRKARTVDASSVLPAQRISSAIAPASPPARKAAKAIAPEIVALAASLDNSPSKIFRYVHDQITYDPKWGADTPPLGTVWEGSGTSWDQAWLLQELLQAAGVDARLEWGEVEISTDVLMNLTGIDDPVRAGDFLTTAGLQVVLLTVGSQIVSARFPHVWVKAHLDYIPNRGARLGTPDTWIRMDPAITAQERTDGLRLDQDVPYVLDDHLLSGTELSPRDDYEAALADHIATQGLPIANLNEAKSLNAQVAEEFPFVPGTLRAKILTTAGESETLPSDFEQDVEIQVREAGGGALLTYETTAAAIYGQRLELVWVGATSSDQATLDLYGGVYATPPYEVRLRPTLRLDGVEVDSGNGEIGSAEDAEIQMTLTPPGATPSEDGILTVAGWDLFAGEHGVLSLDYGRGPPELADRFAQGAAAASDVQEIEGWKLAQAAASYLHALGGDLQHLVDLNWHRLITFNTAIFAVQRGAASTSPDGTPQTFSPGPLSLDVGAMPLAVMPVDGVQVSTVPTMNLVGSQGSFREGEALASVFGGEHLTGVTFLTRAVREGQTVTKVDAINLDAALAASDISSDAKGAVRYAVEQFGFEAWIPESQIESNTFQTTGYILLNPTSGAGGYFVTFERRFTPLDGAVTFHNPIDLDVITAPTDVIATIDAEGIESWTLSTRQTGGGSSTVIATGTGPVDNAVLGQFDPTLLLNGMHDLVLTGNDVAGQPVTGKVNVSVEGAMKVGHFSLSFVDLRVPVSGLDLEVVRTYDSRQRQVGEDFGPGWNLDIRQGSYTNNRVPGDGWQFPVGTFPCTTAIETKSHMTTIRLSELEVYRFKLRLANAGVTLGGCFGTAYFAFVDGPLIGATLEILDNDSVFFANASDRVIDANTFEIFEPKQVRLRTRDQRVFDLHVENGVTRIADANGNELQLSPAGIEHNSGRGIDFERDGEGRLTAIIDPMGRRIEYAYDTEGDLVETTDRSGAVTELTYAAGHYLEEVVDPRGIRGVRSEYDEDGRVVRVTDAAGKVIELSRDLDDRREVIADRLGNVRIEVYDDRGNVTRKIDPLGNAVIRTYDAKDRLLTETDPLGNTIRHTYNAAGDLILVEDPLGNSRSSTYNAAGNLLSQTDPLGRTESFTYDSRGNQLSTTDRFGFVTTRTYNARGQLLTEIDAEGETRSLVYDSFGRLIRETDVSGTERASTYDAAGNRLSESITRTGPGGPETLVTRFEYNDLDRLSATVFADGSREERRYNLLGQMIERIDPLGRSTQFEYDTRARQTAIVLADGSRETTAYDDEGRITSTTDRAGRTESYDYDGRGFQIRTTFADNSSMAQEFDAAGRLVATIDAMGERTTLHYDAAGRSTSVVDALGNVTLRGFDAAGQQIESTDAVGNLTRFVYDAAGRPLETVFADGSILKNTWDGLGRRLSETDPNGATTGFEYDPRGRLTKVTDALLGTTLYTYDEQGNRLSVTDANGHVTRLEYDPRGRQTRRILPDGLDETLAYDAAGNLVSWTDASGAETTYRYDLLDRLIERRQDDGTGALFTYTPTGERASVTDGRGVTTYTYDLRDRLLQKSTPDGYTLQNTWNARGNRTSSSFELADGSVSTTFYSYDAIGRMAGVTDSRNNSYGYAYDATGRRLTTTYPNTVSTSRSYDARGQVSQLTTIKGSGETLQSYTYTYDANGNRQTITDSTSGVQTFSYDPLSRLTMERNESVGGTLLYENRFVYDAVGNRLSEQHFVADGSSSTTSTLYNSRDQITTQTSPAGSVNFTWNAAGHMVSRSGPQAVTYLWNGERRLSTLELGDGTQVEQSYDADGVWVERQVTEVGSPAEQQRFVVDTTSTLSQTMAVLDGSGQLVAEYVRGWGGSELLAILPVMAPAQTAHADALGSIRLLADEDGEVLDSFAFEAFGEAIAGGSGTPSDEPTNRFQFAGEALESTAGIYNLRARWMDPSTGRFLSEDPFPGFDDSPLSLHPYIYALLSPATHTDPSGELVGPTVLYPSRVKHDIQTIGTGLRLLAYAKQAVASMTIIALLVNAALVVDSSTEEKKKRENRGRIQFQGSDLESRWGSDTPPQLQYAWAGKAPSKFLGLSVLRTFWEQLNKAEKRRRTTAFGQATRFVDSGPHFAPTTRSFTSSPGESESKKWKSTPRIDIEIWKGVAFF